MNLLHPDFEVYPHSGCGGSRLGDEVLQCQVEAHIPLRCFLSISLTLRPPHPHPVSPLLVFSPHSTLRPSLIVPCGPAAHSGRAWVGGAPAVTLSTNCVLGGSMLCRDRAWFLLSCSKGDEAILRIPRLILAELYYDDL